MSGAISYQSLCVAAKNEERRQVALKKCKQYHGDNLPPYRSFGKPPSRPLENGSTPSQDRRGLPTRDGGRKCWNCDMVGHLAKDCRKPKKESLGMTSQKPPSARMVQSGGGEPLTEDDPVQYLLSDSDECEVKQVRVQDQGSAHQQAKVIVGGVPMFGLVDTGADVTIMGGSTFKQVAAAAKLHKKDFKPADKTPQNYDRKPLRLDGRLDLDVTFGDRTMKTAIYVKMDAPEPLLLSEGVCRQLGLVTYHPEVKARRGGGTVAAQECRVPAVRVQLVKGVKLPPGPARSVLAEVKWSQDGLTGPLLLESDPQLQKEHGVIVADANCELS